MATTVTTTTITALATAGFVGVLGLICTAVLIGFLVLKEVAGSAPGERSVRWAKTLNIGILPLLFAFFVIVGEKVAAV